jgi:uncharacterized protein (TIGR03435 family)
MKRSQETFEEKLKRVIVRSANPASDRMASNIDRVWERLRSERDREPVRAGLHRAGGSPRRVPRVAFALGAAAIILAAVAAPFVKELVAPNHVYATVETVQGAVYQMAEGKARAITVGERLGTDTPLRTDAGAGAILKLPDGALIEMSAKSELSLQHAKGGVVIQLNDGSLRVTPAPQPSRNLYVQNREETIPVIGAVLQSTAGATVEKVLPSPVQASSIPKWEVVSIRPCDPDTPSVPGARGNNGVGENFTVTPGRFSTQCMRLGVLMNLAYVNNGEPLLNNQGVANRDFIKGPDWVHSSKLSDRYSIEANAEGTPDRKTILGPMLQALLEDRFQLRTHREMEEIPMYSLVVARGGLKIKPINEAECTPNDQAGFVKWVDQVRKGEMGFCGFLYGDDVRPGITGWAFGGHSMDQLAGILSRWVRKPVLDQTGVLGRFRIYLEVSDKVGNIPLGPDLDAFPRPPEDPAVPQGPDVFGAIQDQLGLRLVDGTKGPHQFIVIDHVERPSEN